MTNDKQYTYVDLEYINELSDSDPDFLKEIIGTFLRAAPESLDKLIDALESLDLHAIQFYAHKIKGTFNFLGTNQLSETFDKIELYCGEKTNIDNIRDLMVHVNELYLKMKAELEDILSTH